MAKNQYSPYQVIKSAYKYVTNSDDRKLINYAYEFAKLHQKDKLCQTGEPYIVYATQVAAILVNLKADPATISAGFLHGVVDNEKITFKKIEEEFNSNIRELVEGVFRLDQIKYQSSEQSQAENHRKMFIAMTNDFRVILIKFSKRLQIMRTLKFAASDKQLIIANETLEIFAPLAKRLGISEIQCELEDLALRYLDPYSYFKVVNLIRQKRDQRLEFLNNIMERIRVLLKEADISGEVSGRSKHIYSVYRKMNFKGRQFDGIYDLIAVRIIVTNIKDCYGALGVVHSEWSSVNGRLKDFIAMPKSNMYQSIHTTVVDDDSTPFEIQIRTEEMHQIAQFGLAAHWAYKQNVSVKNTKNADKRLDFLREFIELQGSDADDLEFMNLLKSELLTSDMVYVYTPKGDVYELPQGSVPIDFAYRIHSEVGNKMNGAKINGKIATLDTLLKTGDIVEILTNKSVQGPSQDWLKIAKSTHTKNKIKQFFKKQNRDENIIKGRELIERELREANFDVKEVLTQKNMTRVLERFNFSHEDDLYAALGFGSGLQLHQIIAKLTEKEAQPRELNYFKEQPKQNVYSKNTSGVVIEGIDNLLIRLSKCCNPIPGDDIIGFITKGRGISVHRTDCVNVNCQKNMSQKITNVTWSTNCANLDYIVNIQIFGMDRNDLLSDILAIMSSSKTEVESVYGRHDKEQKAIISMSLHVTNIEQLERIINKIKQIPSVYDVIRTIN